MTATPIVNDAATNHTSAKATRDMLHITNGSAIIRLMQQAGVQGPVVPWNDVLHEGPVPSGLGPAALRQERANFLAGADWGSRAQIAQELEARDRALEQAASTGEVVLWLEHDLYDQLQLIQILDRLPLKGGPRVTAVQPRTYLEDESDHARLFAGRKELTSAELSAARDAWQAFRSTDPRAIVAVLPRVTVLPHLAPALQRHLQQFPSVFNGLSRTEQAALEVIAAGPATLSDAFRQTQAREEAFFMGDRGFLFHLSSLIDSSCPLLAPRGDRGAEASRYDMAREYELTAEGARVMRGELDRVALCGIDRWLGGVYLSGRGPVWRWDPGHHTMRFV